MNRREFIAAAMATVTATAVAPSLAAASNAEPAPAPLYDPAPALKPGRVQGQERVIDFEAHYLEQAMLDWMQGRQSPRFTTRKQAS